MASGSEVVGAAAGAAPLIPALFGHGQNDRLAKGFYGQPGYDPNAAFYGGQPGGLQAYQQGIDQRRNLVDGRKGFQANFSAANHDRFLGERARIGQTAMANQMAARAQGQVPSIAQMQADRQMQQAAAAQASASASARGAAGMALAQQNAAGNVANMQSAISNQAQINAAQERQQAEQAAYGAYSGMRAGDATSEGLATGRAQFQTEMNQRNREANDQRAMGYEQLSGRANEAELGARVQNQGVLAGSYGQAETANQRTSDQNAQGKGILETVGDFFDISDSRAKVMLSDMTGKVPSLLPGGGAMNPAATASFDQLGATNNLDVLGSLKAHSDFATQFQGNPGAGPADAFTSDTAAKKAAVLAEGRKQGAQMARGNAPAWMLEDRARGPYGANADEAALDDRAAQHADAGIGKTALDNAIGQQVASDKGEPQTAASGADADWARSFGDVNAARAGAQESDNRAEAVRIRSRLGQAAPEPGQPGAPAQPQPWWATLGASSQALANAQFSRSDERAKHMLSDERAKVDRGAVADANRTMKGSPYAYKPGLGPPTQAPGEVNVGPMAQNLEQSPVAATVVKTDPGTGLKVIDRDKALKVAMTGIADLQRQQDETRAMLAKGGRKKK